MFESSIEICEIITILVKIWYQILHEDLYVFLCSSQHNSLHIYQSKMMFATEVVERNETQILCPRLFCQKSYGFWDNYFWAFLEALSEGTRQNCYVTTFILLNPSFRVHCHELQHYLQIQTCYWFCEGRHYIMQIYIVIWETSLYTGHLFCAIVYTKYDAPSEMFQTGYRLWRVLSSGI
jgi:hypothetical protein